MAQVYQYNGGLFNAASGGSLFGTLLLAESYGQSLGKSQLVLLDRAGTVSGVLATASHGESFTLDIIGNEQALSSLATVPSTAASSSACIKAALLGTIYQGASSSVAPNNAIAVQGNAFSNGTVAQANLTGAQGAFGFVTGTDGSGTALAGFMINTGGSAVSALQNAFSKYGMLINSAGNAKNTAYVYCYKAANGIVPAVNCSHGVLVDGASVDSNAFAVVSGTTPTVLWGVNSVGKPIYNAADVTIATQAATAALTVPTGLVTITALTLAAATSITVACTTAAGLSVTTGSRVKLTIQSQTGAAAGFVVAAADSVTANAFNIRLTNTAAATAYGGGAFSVYYEIVN